MPWILDPDGNLQEQQEQDSQVMDLSGSAGAGGSGATVAGTMAGQASGPVNTSSGQGFTDINKYLALNQPQANELGQNVAGGIDETTGEATTALTTGEQEFADALSSAHPGMTEQEINDLAQNPANLASFVQDPTNVERFVSTAAGEYTGPGAFSDVGSYADLVASVSGAAQKGEQSTTQGGKQELIRDVYKKPERANAGMLGLDYALVEQSPEGIGAINESGEAASAVTDRLEGIQEAAGESILAERQNVTDRAGDIQNQFMGEGGVYRNLRNSINDRLEATQASAIGATDDARNYMDINWLLGQDIIEGTPVAEGSTYENWAFDPSKVQISDLALQNLGISKDQYVDLIQKQVNARNSRSIWDSPGEKMGYPGIPGVTVGEGPLQDFNDYLSYGQPTDITAGNVATSEEYAIADALNQLFGSRVDFNDLNTPDQAGSVDPDQVDFNYDDLIAYLNQQQEVLDYYNSIPGLPRMGG